VARITDQGNIQRSKTHIWVSRLEQERERMTKGQERGEDMAGKCERECSGITKGRRMGKKVHRPLLHH